VRTITTTIILKEPHFSIVYKTKASVNRNADKAPRAKTIRMKNKKNKDLERRRNNILGGGCRLLAVVLATGTVSVGRLRISIWRQYERPLHTCCGLLAAIRASWNAALSSYAVGTPSDTFS
jgi:hypothetical protein